MKPVLGEKSSPGKHKDQSQSSCPAKGSTEVLLIPEQDHRVDGESAPGRDQSSDDTHTKHGQNDADEDDRVFGRGLIHDERKDTGSQYAKYDTGYGTDDEQPEGAS